MPVTPISIFIDTNIFISAKFDVSDSGIFSTLKKHVENGVVEVYTSNVVIGEVKKHLKERTENFCNAYNKVYKETISDISKNLIETSNSLSFYQKIDKDKVEAELIGNFDDYIVSINTIILNSDDVDCDEVLLDYFNGNYPFENKSLKKCEFPDAIMAAQIMATFDDSNPILLVSNDKGFCSSFTDLDSVMTFASLSDIFKIINGEFRNDNITRLFEIEVIKSEIEKRIKEFLFDGNVIIVGQDYTGDGLFEGYEYEEIIPIEISKIEISSPVPGLFEEEWCNILCTITGELEASCYYHDYDNASWDNEDKEYIFLEYIELIEKHKFSFDASIEVSYHENIVINHQSDDKLKENCDIEDVSCEILKLDSQTRISTEKKNDFTEYY